MNRRNIVIIVVLIILAAGALYFMRGGAFGSQFPYTVIENGDRQYKEDTDYYTIQINYPDKTPLATRSGTGAESKAQNTTADMLKGLIGQFKDIGNVE
jgi:uncharacterized protein YxeA